MGLISIRIVAFLDIILTVVILSQQVTYTKRMSEEYKQPQPRIPTTTTPKPETKNVQKSKAHKHIFRVDHIQHDENSFFAFRPNIPEKWLWPLLFLVVGVGLTSILISVALIITTGPAYTFQTNCSVFSLYLNFFGITIVLSLILLVLGFHVSLLAIYSFLYGCVRSVFVLILVDDFVHLIIKNSTKTISTDKNGGFLDDFWHRLAVLKEEEKMTECPVVDVIPPHIVTDTNLVEIKSEVPPLVFEISEEEPGTIEKIEISNLSIEGSEVPKSSVENLDKLKQ